MKKLNELGLLEMNQEELQETGGGFFVRFCGCGNYGFNYSTCSTIN